MIKNILIIGGYGNFGSYIARSLAPEANIKLFIGGRSLAKAQTFISSISAQYTVTQVTIDISMDISWFLAEIKPEIFVHTTGPFQNQSYSVAEACIRQGCHYIDLADARAFVAGIRTLDTKAKEKNVLIVSGASSVPCLTAAIIDHYRSRFSYLEKVEYGISAAQQTNRGLATTSAILSYVGKPFFTLSQKENKKIYGWQDMHVCKYPELGNRLFGNCDIPDLELFPTRYPELKTIRFSAGHEIAFVHMGLWLLSWLVRAKIMPSLEPLGPLLLKLSSLFDVFGRKRSGFHMFLAGIGKDGKLKTEGFYIIARSGHGPYIPCMPSILLTKGLASGTTNVVGARPCLDLIDLKTYCDALKELDISIIQP